MSDDISSRQGFLRQVTLELGRAAARRLSETGPAGLGTSQKGKQDFVTEVDLDTERALRAAIAERFPDDVVLGEEFGGDPGAEALWVIDPIDGTANFARDLADWGVSIGFVSAGRLALGAIYDGGRDVVYHAAEGQGAFCGDNPISVATTTDPSRALGMVGLARKQPFEDHLEMLAGLVRRGFEYRRHGSAATGLLRVAEGRADYFLTTHLHCWDALGGVLIAAEAGAAVSLPPMADFLAEGGPVLCAAPGVMEPLEALLAELTAPKTGAAG